MDDKISTRVIRKRQRRSYLKPYSANVVHTRQRVLSRAEEGKTRDGADMSNRYHAFALKARTDVAKQDAPEADKKMKLPVIPLDDGTVLLMRTDGANAIPRSTVLYRMWQSQTRGRQGNEEWLSFVLEKDDFHERRAHFFGNKYCIVERLFTKNILRSSGLFNSRELMLQAHRNEFIYWYHIQQLNPSPTTDPPR